MERRNLLNGGLNDMGCLPGFLICPRGPEYEIDDVFDRIPYLRRRLRGRFGTERPAVAEVYRALASMHIPVFPKYRGKTPSGQAVEGFLPVLPQTGRQLLAIYKENRSQFFRRMFTALHAMAKKKINLIGLGTLFGSNLTYGGVIVAKDERAPKIPMASGATLTAGATCQLVSKVIEDFRIDSGRARVAIVGAGGIVGYAVSQGISSKLGPAGYLLLVDRQSHRIHELASWIKENTACPVEIQESLTDLLRLTVDIVVVVTAAARFKLQPALLPLGVIVIDCTTPRNTGYDLLDDPDRLVIDGDLLAAPRIKRFDYGTPSGTIFACHGEIIVLAHRIATGKLRVPVGITGNPYLGITRIEQANELMSWAQELGLLVPPHHSFGRLLSQEKIDAQVELRASLDDKRTSAELIFAAGNRERSTETWLTRTS